MANRYIDTGAVANPDVITAAKIWGFFYNASSQHVYSLFYVDPWVNNLGAYHLYNNLSIFTLLLLYF